MTTSISPKTSTRENIKKGEQRKFCFGHQNRRFIKNHNDKPERGQFIHAGYVYVIAPGEHPHKTNKRYIKRSRLVTEARIGRYLERYEHVHHIDMDRSNDTPENLQVMSLSDHLSMHRRMKHSRCCV
jgi:hypothetical protein